MPDKAPTVAIDGLALVQVPAGVALLNVAVAPTHSLVIPVMGATAGAANTVSGRETVIEQPAGELTV